MFGSKQIVLCVAIQLTCTELVSPAPFKEFKREVKMGNTTNDTDNSASTWMNNEFFEKALRLGEDPNIRVTSSMVTRATAAGDNYASDMYRAVLNISKDGHTEERPIIIKSTKPADREIAKFVSKGKLFDKEVDTFTILFPEMNRLLGGISTSESQQFAAKYIHSNTDERGTTILLEDLKVQGFKLAELKIGLDMKHCLLVMRKIAKFHAASVVMYHKNPDRFELFMSSNMFKKENIEVMKPIFNSAKTCVEEVKKWPGFKPEFVERLSKLSNDPMDSFLEGLARDDTEFNVLGHGDLWGNNMMFRYSEETGEVEDVRFVDFQLSNWTSPGVDLQYFMNSSASPEVLENVEVLKHEYYRILARTLVELGHGHLQPTEGRISDQFEKRGTYGVLTSLSVRVVVLTDRNDVPDMDKVLKHEADIHLSERYLQSVKKLLPTYEKRGWV